MENLTKETRIHIDEDNIIPYVRRVVIVELQMGQKNMKINSYLRL